jgi:hypothetical protein
MTDFKSELRKILDIIIPREDEQQNDMGKDWPLIRPKVIDKAESDIMALFISKGWVQIKTLPNVDPNEPLHWVAGELMTGQDWFDKFEKELNGCTHYIRSLFADGHPTATDADNRDMIVRLDIIEAAQRVSGIKGEIK